MAEARSLKQIFLKKQVFKETGPGYQCPTPLYLLPERRYNDTIRSLRNSQPFSSFKARTNMFHKSVLPGLLMEKFHIGLGLISI